MTSPRSWFRVRSLRGRSVSGGAIFLHDNKTPCKTVSCCEGALVQDIIKDVCRRLDIPPMARVFFALCVREKEIPLYPLSPYYRISRQESKKQYQLRVFINIENSTYLQHVSEGAHEYYYKQLRSDFLDDHLQPRATINSAVWMAAIDMAREAKEKKKNFEDLQGDIHKYMPHFLYKRYKKDSKVEDKIKETFDRFHELNVDSSHYVNKFLEVYEKDKMCGRHLFPLKQSGMLTTIRGTPQLVVISWKEGIYKTVAGSPDDKKESVCSFADVVELKADFSLTQLTIVKSEGSSTTSVNLIFVEQRQLVAFSAIVQAYWRLKVDGSDIILSGDIAPPDVCMKVGKCDRLSLCHGPIAQTSVEKVLEKFRVEEGHFLVRESRTMDDAYTLSVCHNKKVMHYRIVRHDDGMYSFRDPDSRGSGDEQDQKGALQEYEKFHSLHDLIKSYHQKADGLPTLLKVNIAPNVSGKIPLILSKNQPGALTPSSSGTLTPSSSALGSMPHHVGRPRSSSSEDHSYMENTTSPSSSAPQTPSDVNPPPPLSAQAAADQASLPLARLESQSSASSPTERQPSPPPIPQNEHILNLYRAGVPFIRYKDLVITDKLGQGHFSKVFRAKMKDSNKKDVIVAVKIPEVDFDDSKKAEAAKKDLTREMQTMHSFDHHNIVKLIRVSETPHYLDYIGMLPVMIMEFVEGGSLRGYLDEKRKKITPELMRESKTIFLDIGRQIAEGMKYLEQRNVVHRDLAARNVLMVSESHIKISDFGLSRRKVENKEYYKSEQTQNLPIFWYAPECLLQLKFTTQGDIWSYGTTLWEIFTFGDNPSSYLHPVMAQHMQSTGNRLHPYKALADLYKSGTKLPKGNCSTQIYKIITDCWSYDPAIRPTFEKLAKELDKLLQSILSQQRAEGASTQSRQENGYVPVERTIQPVANGSARLPHNGTTAVARVAS